jgi:hypothetical protein
MIYLKNIYVFCFLAFVVIHTGSCKPELDKAAQLEAEVMKIHDEVMPKMTDLAAAKKELGVALENGADSTMVFEYLRKVEEADEAMMVWMEEYESPSETSTEAEKLTYLNLELGRINEVKEKMLKAIKDATTFTSQYIKAVNDTLQ